MLNKEIVKCDHNANRYVKFINSRILMNLTRSWNIVKSENHHIIPVSLGGSNEKTNIVKLTLREHFIAHMILYEVYKNYQMANAMFFMIGKLNTNSRFYEVNRGKYIDSVSGKNHPGFGKNHSEETKLRISLSLTGKKRPDSYKKLMSKLFSGENHPGYGKSLSDSHKKNLSIALKGKKASDETKEKISKARKGKKMSKPGYWSGKKLSQEHIDKCIESKKGFKHSDKSKNEMSQSKKKRYSINGTVYIGRDGAALALDINPDAVKYRCLSNNVKWKDWIVLD